MSMFKGAPKEEKDQQKQTWSNLMNIGDSTRQAGTELGAKGKEREGMAANFFQRLLKGDRTAIAPGVNAAVGASDAQKREQATMGTSRGGGVNEANQKREGDLRGQIMSLFGQQQGAAAEGLANMGAGDIGQSISAMSTSGNINSNLSTILGQDIQQKNAAAHKLWGTVLGGAAKLGMAALFPPAAPAVLGG